MISQGSQQFFPNSSNIAISGGTFINTKSSNSTRDGFKLLLQNICEGAFHNAAERSDPPRCHPQTREAIRAEIMEWVKAAPAMRKLVLWMYGPAGSGKTAILQSIAEECERLGLLAASFFFRRTAPGRDDAAQFIATLAYQLSLHIPQIEDHLFTTIERDPTIFSRSLSKQLRVLVIEPLRLAAPFLSMPIFALIDGIDECGPDGQSQSNLLYLVGIIAVELRHLPFVFLIASRPEYAIREAFSRNILSSLTKVLVLDNSYKPDKDIKIYFDSTFLKIYREHCRLGRRLPSPWPTARAVHSLVSKASGQFIFAATVTKFVDSPRHNPEDRLKIILHSLPGGDYDEKPFAQLDLLYRFILDSVVDHDFEKLLDILAFLLLIDNRQDRIYHLEQAEELLNINFQATLIDMHSLVHVPPPSRKAELPSFYHASLVDFLMNRSRSCRYYIGISDGHLRVSRRCLKTIIESHGHFQCLSTRQVVQCFINHAEKLPASEDLVKDLARFDLRAWLEGISDFNSDIYDPNWKGFFDCARQWLGSGYHDVFLRLQNDFDAFIFDRIQQYPPSLRAHIPVLLCCLHYTHSFDIFRILLLGASRSEEEYNKLLDLDRSLLQMAEATNNHEEEDVYISGLFQDNARAGKYFVDGGSYVALAKAIMGVVFFKPKGMNYRITLETFGWNNGRYGGDPKTRMPIHNIELWAFPKILEKASQDKDFAKILRKHAIQFRRYNYYPESTPVTIPTIRGPSLLDASFLDLFIVSVLLARASLAAWWNDSFTYPVFLVFGLLRIFSE